jgi:hypothetical protein
MQDHVYCRLRVRAHTLLRRRRCLRAGRRQWHAVHFGSAVPKRILRRWRVLQYCVPRNMPGVYNREEGKRCRRLVRERGGQCGPRCRMSGASGKFMWTGRHMRWDRTMSPICDSQHRLRRDNVQQRAPIGVAVQRKRDLPQRRQHSLRALQMRCCRHRMSHGVHDGCELHPGRLLQQPWRVRGEEGEWVIVQRGARVCGWLLRRWGVLQHSLFWAVRGLRPGIWARDVLARERRPKGNEGALRRIRNVRRILRRNEPGDMHLSWRDRFVRRDLRRRPADREQL